MNAPTPATRPLTHPLRPSDQFPRLGSVVRFAWRVARAPYRRFADRARARALLRWQESVVGTDPLFDVAHYRMLYPGLDQTGMTALQHYLAWGRVMGLTPHPLFDPAWYHARYPDIGDQEPLVHYLLHGRAEDRWPNPFFDPVWYRRQHPVPMAAGQDPLLHFAAAAPALRLDPSPLFGAGPYLDWHADVAASNTNPLVHYLLSGRAEARPIFPDEADAPAVEATPIAVGKQPRGGAEVALLVTHSPDGRLQPHVPHYLRALRREGIAVTLIVAADQDFTDDLPWLHDLVDGLYLRRNEGWDFACWAHVLRLNRAFYEAQTLYWLNDSLLGPVNDVAFHALLSRVRASTAGMVGLTASSERGDHIQSFFLAFKPAALGAVAFQRFVLAIRSLGNKESVIRAYETTLAQHLRAAGIRTEALFGPATADNAALRNWPALLRAGFPFLKVSVLLASPDGLGDGPGDGMGDGTNWRDALRTEGYDVALADQVIAWRIAARAPAQQPAQPRHPATLAARTPPQISFIGPFNYANGLGVAARGYVAALMHLPLPTNVLPIERPFHVHGRVAPSVSSTECVGPADLALVHLNPDAWDVLLTPEQAALVAAARKRVGLFVWESQDVPTAFAAVTRRLDAIWVPSRFCAEAFRRVSDVPVQIVPYVVPVLPRRSDPARAERLRRALGLGPEQRIILFSFDASSYLKRKNPHALVCAFGASGLAAAGWSLVLKTKHLDDAEDGPALRALAERTAGTLLLNRPLDRADASALMDLADLYASPHASEGFGLTIAEAMAMGKPVIASDFGGSTDFLDAGCGFPVPCTPWQLDETDGAYPRGTTWGRIDEARLTDALLAAASLSAPDRARLGDAAQQRIRTLFSPDAVAATMQAALADILRA